MTAREAALKALGACRKSGAWSETFLRNYFDREEMDNREAALASKITYGVLQNTLLLDFYIDEYSSVRTGKMEPKVLDILRMSVYQLVFLSKIPERSAVDEGVKLAKKHSNKAASGLVNAVLRRIAENREKLPEPCSEDRAWYLSVKYSHPIWLVREFIGILGHGGAEELLICNNGEAPVTAQVNTLKTDTDKVLAELKSTHIQAMSYPWLRHCIELERAGDITKLTPFEKGHIYIQDPAARLAVMAASPRPGCSLLDCCAAPGGKTFAAAIAMENTGEIISCDIHEKKLGLIRSGARRLGIDIVSTLAADARVYIEEFERKFDVVIADVPCSGTGVIRKKPEIRFKSERDTLALPDIQRDILRNMSRYVKPGGTLIYSTCSILQIENENIFKGVLAESGDFSAGDFSFFPPVGQSKDGMLTLYPHIHGTDGFFIGKMRRKDLY